MTGNSNNTVFQRESMAGENRRKPIVNPSLNWFTETLVSKPGYAPLTRLSRKR
jgi:hypothetical protein